MSRWRHFRSWPAAFLCLLSWESAGAQVRICFEAEHCNLLVPPFEIWEDVKASGGRCLILREGAGAGGARADGNGYAIFGIRVPRTGAYSVWGRALWRHVCSNSMYIAFGDGQRRKTIAGGVLGRWAWRRGPTVHLAAGEQLVWLKNREDGVAIDQIMLILGPGTPQEGAKATCVPGRGATAKGWRPLEVSFSSRNTAIPLVSPSGDILGHRYALPAMPGKPTIRAVVTPGTSAMLDVWVRNSAARHAKGWVGLSLPPGLELAGETSGGNASRMQKVAFSFAEDEPLHKVRLKLTCAQPFPIQPHQASCRVMANGRILHKRIEIVRPYEWCVVGPFTHLASWDVNRPHPPEQGIDVKAEYDGMKGKVRWRHYPPAKVLTPFGALDLRRAFGNDVQWAAAYAVTELTASADGEAALRLAADDMAKIWINGEVIGAATRTTPATLNQQAHRVRLNRGRNRIMAKVVQKRGYWELGMFVAPVDPSKMSVRGLSLRDDLSFVDTEVHSSP